MKINNKTLFWFSINRYALILLLVSLLAFGTIFILRNIYLDICIAILGAILLFFGLKIISSYSQKIRAFHILSRNNKRSYSENSLKDYMVSPCGRILVKTVLLNIGEEEKYSSLKKSYHIELFQHQQEIIKIYKVQ